MSKRAAAKKPRFRVGQVVCCVFKILLRKDYGRIVERTENGLWRLVDANGAGIGLATNKELRPLTAREKGLR